MIAPLQNTPAIGGATYTQQQTNVAQAATDIRTNNAQQVETRNVEHPDQTNPLQPDKTKEQSKGKGNGQNVEGDKKPLVPPPPNRYDIAIEERLQKANQTQQAATKFLLSAAAHAPPRTPEPILSHTGPQVDITV